MPRRFPEPQVLDLTTPLTYNLLVSKQSVKSLRKAAGGGSPQSVRSTGTQRLPSFHARMRSRRAQLGLTGAELAQRAGISASYVSLIESGAKVPDDDVAGALARALGDDEALYRAWARGTRLGLHDLELLKRLEISARTPAFMDLMESGHELPELDGAGSESPGQAPTDLESRMRAVASRLDPLPPTARPGDGAPATTGEALTAPPSPAQDDEAASEADIARVPVLRDGADPGRLAPSPATIRDRLLVDRRLVQDHDPKRLFAYDVTEQAMAHLRGVANPGDRIVFRRGGRVEPDRICAVRTGHGVVLSRVLLKGRSLLLLPGDGESDFESVDLERQRGQPSAIAGTHVLLIRQ